MERFRPLFAEAHALRALHRHIPAAILELSFILETAGDEVLLGRLERLIAACYEVGRFLDELEKP
ncbi:MAG: hypothetical protein AMXMBFR13_38450 [Phycisphaerae bacterium]